MTGVEFLEQARSLAPDAKLVLLTAYADTDVAIKAINDIGLDYYLLKPWDPPEERLYPVLDDLLSDWRRGAPGRPERSARRRPPLVGAEPRDQDLPRPQPRPVPLARSRARRGGQRLHDAARRGRGRSAARAPPRPGAVARAVDARPRRLRSACARSPSSRCTTCASSAAGPPGWRPRSTARRKGLQTVVIEREAPGGQAGQSAAIENYLGFPQGPLRCRPHPPRRRAGQALRRRDGARPRRRRPRDARAGARRAPRPATCEIEARTVLVATGVSYRLLDAPGLEELTGRGVYYGATASEARSVRGRRRLRRRRGQLGRPGGAEHRPLRPTRRRCWCGRTRWRSRCRSTSSNASAPRDNIEVRLQHRGRRRSRRRPPRGDHPRRPRRRHARRTCRRTGCSSSSARRRAPTGSATTSLATSEGFVITGADLLSRTGAALAAGRVLRSSSRRACPACSPPATCASTR